MKLIDFENIAVDYDPMDALLSALHETRRRIAALEAELEVAKAENDLKDSAIDRLRGQLQNCINHVSHAKRASSRRERPDYDQCIESANRALYESLNI